MLDFTDVEDSVLERLELPLLVIGLSMARQGHKDTYHGHFHRIHRMFELSQTALMDRIEALTSPESEGDDDGGGI